MFNHLLGRGHREKFFGNKYETDYEKVNSHKISQMAEKERENKNIEFITTIYSDELYPWLSGKAPWSSEQGSFFPILFTLILRSLQLELRKLHNLSIRTFGIIHHPEKNASKKKKIYINFKLGEQL